MTREQLEAIYATAIFGDERNIAVVGYRDPSFGESESGLMVTLYATTNTDPPLDTIRKAPALPPMLC